MGKPLMLMKSPIPGVLKSRMDFHSFEMDDLSGTFLKFKSKTDRKVHSLSKVEQKKQPYQTGILKSPMRCAFATPQPQ